MILNTQNFGLGVWDGEVLPRLLRLDQIIEQEQAIAYTLTNLDSLFRQKYPGYRPITDWSREYDLWTRTTLDAERLTAQLQKGALIYVEGRLRTRSFTEADSTAQVRTEIHSQRAVPLRGRRDLGGRRGPAASWPRPGVPRRCGSSRAFFDVGA